MKGWSFLLFPLILLYFGACQGDEEESVRSKTLKLLTGNSSKSWGLSEYFLDDQPTDVSQCDSSYILTMKSDYTWQEQYTNLQCYPSTTGQWRLNDENNVIIINYVEWSSGQNVERKFEIIELSEEYFTYQFAIRNSLKRIKMHVYG